MRTEIANLIVTTELDLQDVLIQFGHLTEDNIDITIVKEFQTRPYEVDDDIWTSILYERDLDYHRVDREVYSILDWLGDIGGLYEAMSLICAGILYLFNFMSYDNYLVSELFKKENDDDDGKDDRRGSSKAKSITRENEGDEANDASQ